MKSTYSISKAQSNFPSLVRDASDGASIAITRHDETVAYVISRGKMEAIAETLHILANPKAMAALRSHAAGKTRFHPVEAMGDEG